MRLSIVHAVRSDGFAGVERHIAALARVQTERGHRVAVVGGDPVRMRLSLQGLDLPLHPAATTWQVARALGRLGGADVIHVHMTAAEASALLAVGHWRTPVVTTRHFAGRRGSNPLVKLAGPMIRRRLAAQIAISEFVAHRIEGPSTVVYSGVPDAPLVQAGARQRIVLVAQRLEPEKKTDMALRAFAASGLAERGWALQVAGSGSQHAALVALAEELGIAGATEFLGLRDDIDQRLTRAGLLIAPCEVEGFGLAVLEGMASGLPIVAAAAGGHLETVGLASEAHLYPVGDAAAAGAHLARLAADPERRDAYGADLHALQRQRFTMEAQALATNDVYRGIL